MRIQHNIAALNAHRQLTGNNSALSKNLEKLSSGYRINRAGDDAAGLAISEKMRAQITGLNTAQKNAEDGVSLIQTAEGYMSEVHSMLNRMSELATQSANGVYSTTERQKISDEVTALTEEIDRIANVANFNGKKLFDQANGNAITLQIGEVTGSTNNTFQQVTLTVSGATSTELGITTLAAAMISQTEASDAIATINTAIDYVSGLRGGLGAMQNRLEHTINNLGTTAENMSAAESRIRDVDMAKEMMAYSKNNILVQASQSMLAQANQVPQGVLQLLQ